MPPNPLFLVPPNLSILLSAGAWSLCSLAYHAWRTLQARVGYVPTLLWAARHGSPAREGCHLQIPSSSLTFPDSFRKFFSALSFLAASLPTHRILVDSQFCECHALPRAILISSVRSVRLAHPPPPQARFLLLNPISQYLAERPVLGLPPLKSHIVYPLPLTVRRHQRKSAGA